MKTVEEIEDMRYKADDIKLDPNNKGMWGMSYEEGVSAALAWVLGEGEAPIEEED